MTTLHLSIPIELVDVSESNKADLVGAPISLNGEVIAHIDAYTGSVFDPKTNSLDILCSVDIDTKAPVYVAEKYDEEGHLTDIDFRKKEVNPENEGKS